MGQDLIRSVITAIVVWDLWRVILPIVDLPQPVESFCAFRTAPLVV